jgi:Ras GTPase-activating protein 1
VRPLFWHAIHLSQNNRHWLFVTLQADPSLSGFVPRNHVEELADLSEREAASRCQLPSAFHRSRWIHGKMERKDADALLKEGGQAGSFFVRESTSLVGSYALSFRGPVKIQHFPISVKGPKFECGGRPFDCLEAIILRYKTDPLMDDTTLQFPIAPVAKYTDQFDVDGAIYSTVELAQTGPAAPPPKPVPIYERRRLSMVEGGTSAAAPTQSTGATATGGYLHGGGGTGGGSGGEGNYTKMGTMVKKARRGKNWKPMFFCLLGSKKCLYYFDNQHAMKPKGIIDLDTAAIELADNSLFGRPNCFTLVVQHPRCMYLCCDTAEDRLDWLTALGPFCGQLGFAPLQPNPNTKCFLTSVNLSVMEAKKFGLKAGAKTYGLVSFGGIKHARTPKVAIKGESAFFGEEFVFPNVGQAVTGFSLDIYSRGNFAVKDKVVTGVPVTFAGLKENEETDSWHDMWEEGGGKSGSVRLKITLIKDILLPVAEYNRLQDILCTDGIEACLLIGELHHSAQLNEYASDLNTIWRATDTTVTMLDGLNQAVVHAESRPETLFRGNSLASKTMDQYMKMTAIPFLHAAIREPVKRLFEDKRSCELDTTRDGGKSDNLKVLLEHANAIVDGIYRSLPLCPPPLREVFDRLQTAVVKKWPDDRAVRFTSISAFLFLRLVCPAIMNPKLFNMMPDHPSDTTARNLTLVAKLVQNLVNMTEFGQKESYMMLCNSWIQDQRGKMQGCINDVASIGGNPFPGTRVDTRRALASVLRGCTKEMDKLCDLVAKKEGAAKTAGESLLGIIGSLDAKLDYAE